GRADGARRGGSENRAERARGSAGARRESLELEASRATIYKSERLSRRLCAGRSVGSARAGRKASPGFVPAKIGAIGRKTQAGLADGFSTNGTAQHLSVSPLRISFQRIYS